VRVANAFEAQGISVVRLDLPYRVKKPTGPPPPGSATADRAGISEAVKAARDRGHERVFIGGHSYGGRQSTLLAAEDPGIAEGLLLLAYPLRPPRPKGAAARTTHFPDVKTPALFFHGSRDPFGSADELRSAIELIPAAARVIASEGDGHELAKLDGSVVVAEFTGFFMK
jgi:predicted alpha/beta-hydrolase family hydrolase